MLLVSPERLNNPGFRDEVLPAARGDLRAAGGRRGALHLRLGPRLPARLPPHPHPARRPARRASRCSRRPRPPTPGSPTTSPSSSAARDAGRRPRAPRHPRPRVAAARRGPAARPPSSGWPGWPTTSAEQPGSGIVYCLTVAATQEVADYLRSRGHEVAAYSGQTEPTERHALEQDLVHGRVKALIATSALGMGFDATLGFVVNLGAPPSPVAYYQQVGRAGRGTDRGAPSCCCRRSRTATSGPTSPRSPSRARSRSAAPSRCSPTRAGTMSTATLETYVELNRNRLETMLKVLDVDGAVRRVRGGWESTGQPWAYDEERYRRVRRGPRARAAGDARLHRDRPAAGCAFLRDQLDDPEAVDCGRCDNCGGLDARRRGLGGGGRGGRGPAVAARASSSSPARCGRPRWPTSASTCAARSARRPRRAARSPGSPTSATATRCASCSRRRRPTARCRCRWSRAVVEVLGDWRPPVDGIVVVESATRPTLTADLADGLSRYLRCPSSGRYAIVDPDVAPGPGGGQLRPADRGGRPPVRPPGRRSRRGAAGSCSSTTGSAPAGRSPWPPGRSAPPARPRSGRWCSRPSPERTDASVPIDDRPVMRKIRQ